MLLQEIFMDVLTLARFQFALTVMFHYIFPVLSIGLGLVLVIVEGIYMWKKNPLYLAMAKFWTKIFALTFAIGVATGIVMEFEFGTNWATYSKYVGDVFGSALAAEGVFAFFLESGFLAILLFGWERVSARMHYFATVMVALGAHFSAIWIVVANSWMQTPAGYHIVGEGMSARAEIIDFWGMVLNPSSMDRLIHVVIGCWLAGAFLMISVSAYYLLKRKHEDFAKQSLKIGLCIALIACILQAFSGHSSGQIVAKHQPAKLAAIEGLFQTDKGVGLTLFGLVNTKEERVDYALKIPKLLSFLVFHDPDAEIKGLSAFPKNDWPNTAAVFQVYRLMIYCWSLMLMFTLLSLFFLWKQRLFEKRWLLWLLVFSVLLPQLANQAGWVAAEIGRYPWIVYNQLRISEGLSKTVTANQVLGSIILFMIVYGLLFILFIYLLHQKIKIGPEQKKDVSPYHLLSYINEEIPSKEAL